jgi:hydrogenase 3 maturation protease
MSRPLWSDSLTQKRTSLRSKGDGSTAPHVFMNRPYPSLRVAIVGIGHELRGDDAAGVSVARSLQSAVGTIHPGTARHAISRPKAGWRAGGGKCELPLLVIDAGAAPENFTGPLRRFDPDLVLLIDAAQLNEAPGSIRWLDWQETSGLSASTHTLPPHVLAEYLVNELGCEVALIGIQPQGDEFDAPLSPPVQQAVDELVRTLERFLS